YERRFPGHVALIGEVYREALPQGFRSTHPTPAEQAHLDTDEPSAPASGTDPGAARAGARGRLDLDWDGTRAYAPGAAAQLSTQRERESEQTGDRPLPRVPDYEILRVLGRGGMGIVYQARHRELNRLVALKMLLATADTHELARFRSEANAVARLQH